MENDHFYMDLLSDTQNEYFANTQGQFIIPLQEPLVFNANDQFEVGLAEIHYINSFSIYRNFKIKLSKSYLDPNDLLVKSVRKTIRVEIFTLKNIIPIVHELNTAIEKFNSNNGLTGVSEFKGHFRFVRKNYKIQLNLFHGESLQLTPDKFATLLGFNDSIFYGNATIQYDPDHGPGIVPEHLLVTCEENTSQSFIGECIITYSYIATSSNIRR